MNGARLRARLVPMFMSLLVLLTSLIIGDIRACWAQGNLAKEEPPPKTEKKKNMCIPIPWMNAG